MRNPLRNHRGKYSGCLQPRSLLAGFVALSCLLAPQAFAQTNLAQGKAISASSYADVYAATNANDGNQATYWESQNNAFPQSLTLDLGAATSVNQVKLKLPSAWGARTETLSVLGSVDGSSFSTIKASQGYSFDPNSSNTVAISFADTNARYVRVQVTGNSGWAAGQFSEFEVYGAATNNTRDAFSLLQAESFDTMSGIQTENTADTGGGANVGWIDNGDWLQLKNVDFGSGAASVKARVASDHSGGTIELHLDSISGTLIGTVDLGYTGGWQTWVTQTANATASGKHDLYLVFKGTATGGLFNLNWIQFDSAGVPTLPTVPQGLSSTGVTTSSVSLAWNSVSNASGYQILRNGNQFASTSGTSYEDTGLAANTSYSYAVRAYNAQGTSALSSSISVKTNGNSLPLPAVPQGVNITGVTDTSVSLSWAASSDATGYDIYRNGSVAGTTTSTSFTDTGLSKNTSYTYTVEAYNATGSSDASAAVSATTTGGSTTPVGTNVAQGKKVTASSTLSFLNVSNAVDGDQATYWESNSNAFPQTLTVDLVNPHFVKQVILTLPNDSAWATRTQTIAVLGSSDGSNFTNLAASAGYVFNPASANTVAINFAESRVRYVRLQITGNTGWPAAQISEYQVIGYPDPVPPATPSGLSVSGATSSSIFLSWNAAELAASYDILRNGVKVASSQTPAYEDAGLDPLTSYSYQVRAVNQCGNSSLSNQVTGTTLDPSTDPGPHPEPNGEHGAAMPYHRYDTQDASMGGGAQLREAPTFDQSLTASEASGQAYTALPSSGAYAEWTVRDGEGGAGVTMRFTMPDSSDGMGRTGSLDVYVNGQKVKTVNLTSYYNWQYFSGDQPADAPGGGDPLFRFDEVHWKLPVALQAGDKIRIQKSAADSLEYGVDFLEIEDVPGPVGRPANSVSPTDFGAVADDGNDDLSAFNAAVTEARATGKSLYIPTGTFNLNNMWVIGSASDMIQDFTIMGAGIWYTNIQFTNPNASSGGISFRIQGKLDFSHIYMNSMLRSRYNQNAVYKGFMDNLGNNSHVHNIWVEHFETGFWVGDYAHVPAIHAENLLVEHCRVRNNLADGINFAQGTSNSTVRNCSIRNNGDDGLAVWTSNVNGAPEGVNNSFINNTIEYNWRAAAIAFFGGSGHKATNNLIVDIVGGSGFRMNTVFPGYHFQNNTGITFSNNTMINAGTSKDLYHGERGAIDLEASSDPIKNLLVEHVDIYNSQRDAIQLGYGGGFQNIVFNDIVINGTGLDGVTTSRFAGQHKGSAIYSYTNNGSITVNDLYMSNIAYTDLYFLQPGFVLNCTNCVMGPRPGGSSSASSSSKSSVSSIASSSSSSSSSKSSSSSSSVVVSSSSSSVVSSSSVTSSSSSVAPGTPRLISSGKPATATSTLSFLSAANAFDGDTSTYWESNSNAFPQALTVDLGGVNYVSKLVLKLPNNSAWEARTQTLSVLTSQDGSSFTQLVASKGYLFDYATGNQVSIAVPDTAARYVRIQVTGNTAWPAAQIAEMEVTGYPNPVPPSVPTGLAVGGGSDVSVYLSWSASTGSASSYEILRNGVQVGTSTANSYLDTGLTPATTYSYAVRAVNEFGKSALSNSVQATTLDEITGPDTSARGATMPYVILQAEDGTIGGGAVKLAPNRTIGDLAGEASGRSAVTLNTNGAYVEWQTTTNTNTLVTRFSIPDAAGGGGTTATLNIYVDGQFEKAITLSSKYAWLYGDETSPNNNPSGQARHIYDEANIMFDRTIPAGSTIRLQKDGENSSQYAIDFISLEQVAPLPNPNPAQYVVPQGFTHQDVQNALDQARMQNLAGVYLPPGVYQTSNKFQIYGKPIVVTGAGPWYTRFETPQNQSNTDAGFMAGNTANGSTFSNFSFFGNYTSRIDGPGKVFDFNGVSDMTIDNVWAEHQVCLLWGANTHNTTVKNSRIRDLFADGVNFTNGSSGNHVFNSEARSTGDDSFALFAATDGAGGIVQNNLFENLTAMTPWRAAGLAAYGGQGNTFRNILVEDTLTYSGLTVSSLDFGYAFTGFQESPTTNFDNITLLRTGGHFWGQQVFPALWMFSASSTFRGIRFSGLEIYDSTYAGIMFQTMYSGGTYKNVFENPIFTNTKVQGSQKSNDAYNDRSGYGIWCNPMPEAGQGPGVGTATFNGLQLINNAINTYNPCADFSMVVNP